MSRDVYLLGIALHTEGLAFCLINDQGDEVYASTRAYGVKSESSFQEPMEWWRALRTGCKELIRRSHINAGQIRGISVTAPTQGLVCLGSDGMPLAPSAWQSNEALDVALQHFTKRLGPRNCVNVTGGLPSSACLGSQLFYHIEHSSRLVHSVTTILSPKDFILFRMTEKIVTDAATAASSGLFNPRNRVWSKLILTQLSLHPQLFPQVASGDQICGRVTAAAAKETGLSAGTPVVTGTSLCLSQATVAGALFDGDVFVESGHKGSLVAVSSEAPKDPQGVVHCGCHFHHQLWTAECDGMLSEQGMDWWCHTMSPGEAQMAKRSKKSLIDHLSELARHLNHGRHVPLVLPPNDHNVGLISDIRPEHSREHIAQALLEQGPLAVADLLQNLPTYGADAERLLVAGRLAENAFWCQLLADVCGMTVTAFVHDQPGALGAALIAGVGTGAFASLEQARASVAAEARIFEADESAIEYYLTVLDRYQSLRSRPLEVHEQR